VLEFDQLVATEAALKGKCFLGESRLQEARESRRCPLFSRAKIHQSGSWIGMSGGGIGGVAAKTSRVQRAERATPRGV
jgi:hypothetical protein